MAKWLILNGSPRINGQSAKVIRMLTLLIENKLPDIELEVFEVARHPVEGCNGCEFCNTTDECIIEDEMAELPILRESLRNLKQCLTVFSKYIGDIPGNEKRVNCRLNAPFLFIS